MIRNSIHEHERVFEDFLRSRRIPHVAVDEARKTLLPETASPTDAAPPTLGADRSSGALKSFDFVVYTRPHNLLIDVKGRSAGVLSRVREPDDGAQAPITRRGRTRPPRLESWVTADDLDSLTLWESLFGPGFRAAFAFVYPLADQPPDGLFQEITFRRPAVRTWAPSTHVSGWYALQVVPLEAYRAAMRPRSAKWRTFDLDGADLHRLAMPIVSASTGRAVQTVQLAG